MTDDERVRITLALMMMPVTAEHSEAMAVDWARRAAEEADVHMADMMLERERYCRLCAKIARELGIPDAP